MSAASSTALPPCLSNNKSIVEETRFARDAENVYIEASPQEDVGKAKDVDLSASSSANRPFPATTVNDRVRLRTAGSRIFIQ